MPPLTVSQHLWQPTDAVVQVADLYLGGLWTRIERGLREAEGEVRPLSIGPEAAEQSAASGQLGQRLRAWGWVGSSSPSPCTPSAVLPLPPSPVCNFFMACFRSLIMKSSRSAVPCTCCCHTTASW